MARNAQNVFNLRDWAYGSPQGFKATLSLIRSVRCPCKSPEPLLGTGCSPILAQRYAVRLLSEKAETQRFIRGEPNGICRAIWGFGFKRDNHMQQGARFTGLTAGHFGAFTSRMHKVYWLFIGVLLVFSTPVQAPVREHPGPKGDYAESYDYSQSEEVRPAGWALTTPRQSISSTMVGLGLIGFVFMNAKRKERV